MTVLDLSSLSVSSNVLVGLVAIGLGLLSCFFGYRIFRFLLALYGFVAGGWAGAVIANNLVPGQTLWLVVGALAGAIVGAILMAVLYRIGVFVAGAFGGVLLANAIGAVANVPMPIVAVVIIAIVVGILALIFQRAVLIVLTAFAGAWGAVSGGALLIAGRSLPAISIVARPQTWEQANLPMLAILISWLVLGAIGMLVQFRITRGRSGTRSRPRPENPRDVW